MTPDEFRELALSLEGVTEGAHMGHADFRAHGNIFSTLGYPDEAFGMVKLPLVEQKRLIELQPQVFTPAKGAWGSQGSTLVQLALVAPEIAQHALHLAWQECAVGMAKKTRGGTKSARKATTKKARS